MNTERSARARGAGAHPCRAGRPRPTAHRRRPAARRRIPLRARRPARHAVQPARPPPQGPRRRRARHPAPLRRRRPAHLPQAAARRARAACRPASRRHPSEWCSCARPTPPAPSSPPRSGAPPARCPWPPPAPTPRRGSLPAPAKQLDGTGSPSSQRPRRLSAITMPGDLIVSVCDNAHEELGGLDQIHWSVPDPVPAGTPAAFDARSRRPRRPGPQPGRPPQLSRRSTSPEAATA